MQQRSIVRLAPGKKSINSRKKVGQGVGWLPGVWKLKWGRIRIPCGVQFNAGVRCGRKGVYIVDVVVRVFSFCPPPVSQVQQLLRKDRNVGRQVSCSGKITQKESALASVEPLQCWGSRLRRETAPEGIPLQCQHVIHNLPRDPVVVEGRSRGEDRRATQANEGPGRRGRAGEPSPTENNLSHTEGRTRQLKT